MDKKQSLRISVTVLALVAMSASYALAAAWLPGRDPVKQNVIWMDTFDLYSQWAYDNSQWWLGGPVPPGSPTGTYPSKSADGTGCGVSIQTWPALHEQLRQRWLNNDCSTINTGYELVGTAHIMNHYDPLCGGSGEWVTTKGMLTQIDTDWWGSTGQANSLSMLTHNFYAERIQNFQSRAWDMPDATAVNGTDEHPLTLSFYMHDGQQYGSDARSIYMNSYVELSLDEDHAPTDYIWRGGHDIPYPQPECCPQGPYPIICQQAREVNVGNYEAQVDLDYLNAHCPSLVPPYDPQTGTGKTWNSIALGFLAVMCKDPCTCEEQGGPSHRPQMNHLVLFDGNKWRELRTGRGTALTQCPPAWPPQPDGREDNMVDSGGGMCGNFSLVGGGNWIYMKLTTNKILIWHANGAGENYCGAFDRVYKGPFNSVSIGTGPGCELQDKSQGDVYTCKSGGTPKQCLTYSTKYEGYYESRFDSMNLLGGILVQNTNEGACCRPDGVCLDGTTQSECVIENGAWRGPNTLCSQSLCCPTPFADADHDGDVDQDDFGAFQLCYNGEGAVPTGCECFDRNNDNRINTTDFTSFGNCWTGPNVPWSAGITPSCAP